MDVLVVGFEHCCALDLTGPTDVFANACVAAGAELYTLSIVGGPTTTEFATESGVRIRVDGSLRDRASTAHTVLVSGGDGYRRAMADADLIADIADAATHARRVVSVCTGAFLLAEAGLLDGRRATTHWADARALADEYPAVRVVPDAIYVEDGPIMTSAGVTAGIDLALAIVARDHGAELARTVARRMVVYLNRGGGQSQFSERLEYVEVSDRGIDAAVSAALADPTLDHTVAAMARRAAMSERNFTRRFRAESGTTPARWVERVRIDRARELLESTNQNPAHVAEAVGFASHETMRQAFTRVLGVSPAGYRRQHRSI